MKRNMADIVLQDALRDRSFAGLFPYASNTPMKVFAGNEPAVPVAVIVEALDDMQAGSANSKVASGAKERIAPKVNMCMSQCQQQHEACLQAAGGSMSAVPKDAWAQCNASLMNVCIPKCMMSSQQ